jgi:hypothetical protein
MTLMTDPTDGAWRRVFERADWPELLAEALGRAASSTPVAERFEIDGIDVVRDSGGALLDIRYRTSSGLRVGRRWRASDVPPAGAPESVSALDVAGWVALWIIRFELGEPLGSYARHLTTDDDGVGWWGDGYAVP